jgi:pimeloyl-ACP methyl ester carboxylesterase
MPFTPFLLPITWVVGLLSLAVVGGGLYILWLWYVGAVVGAAYLVGGLATVIVTCIGRWLVLLQRRPGIDEPRAARASWFHRVLRPDGTELRIESYGRSDGPTIILTHGWGTNSTEWYYAKQHLADRFRLIGWDLPGHGKSRGPTNNDYRPEKMAEDLEAVVACAGTQPVMLLGHSIGGMVTLTFCRRFPHYLGRRVAGLVLLNTTATSPVRSTSFSGLCRALQAPLLTPLLHLTIWLWPLVWLMNWISYINGSTHLQTLLSGFTGHESRGQLDVAARFTPLVSPAVLARGMLAAFQYDETATLPTITIPTLVLASHLDRVLVPEASRAMAAALPSAELVTLRPAGHMGLFEQHEQLTEAVRRFSARCFRAEHGGHVPSSESGAHAPVAVS